MSSKKKWRQPQGRVKAFQFVKNLVKQQVPTRKIDSSDNIIKWEAEGYIGWDNFPQQLIQNVYNSPVGSAALDVWEEFTEGAGFVQEECNNIPVNSDGETLADLHSKVAADLALLWGFAIHISYNMNGLPTEYKHVPMESTRLGLIDKDNEVQFIKFNPYFGIPQDKWTLNAKTRTYYPYTSTPEEVREQMANHVGKTKEKYPGQVFWFSIERPLARVYPQPFYYSAINWFKIDAEIQKFHERNINNNFLLSVLINMYGNPGAPAGPEAEQNRDEEDKKKDQYQTVGEVFNEQMEAHFAGAENGGSALVNWFLNETEKADIQPFPTNSNHDLFLALQKLTTDQISIGTKVPPILLSIQTAGKLGDTQEILNAVKVMQARTARLRNTLTKQYRKIFKGFVPTQNCDFTIKNLNPYDILPQWVIATLTTQEKREYIAEKFPISINTSIPVDEGGNPAETTVNTAMTNLTGRQLQGIQRIVRKYNKEEITFEQAASLLKAGFGMNDEEVNVWLVTPEEEEIIEQ